MMRMDIREKQLEDLMIRENDILDEVLDDVKSLSEDNKEVIETLHITHVQSTNETLRRY